MTIDNVISRLAKVKQTGRDTYIACCPNHKDARPSLSIKALPDGRILMHCFAECPISDVLSSIGLQISDLFPEKLGDFKKFSRPFPAADVLRAVGFECLVVLTSATKIQNNEEFTSEDRERLATAVNRIQAGIDASGVGNGKF
jgi:hypothetical protein